MLVPFSSLVTFPDRNRSGQVDERPTGAEARSMTVLPPSTSHLLCTSNFPAPATFLAWHYARQTLQAGGHVVWIDCTASGEEHVRLSLRKAIAKASDGDPLVYLDALDTLSTNGRSSVGGDVEDARPSLLRLRHRLEQVLQHLRSKATMPSDEPERESMELRPILIVIDDAAALSWLIEQLTAVHPTDEANERGGEAAGDARKGSVQERQEDPRIKLLRDKRKQGSVAIHRDEVGEQLAIFLDDEIHAALCSSYAASLLTNLTADNTSILAPEPHTKATRGGSYGVGTGFDADDAGEEDEEEELYEEHFDDAWHANEGSEGGEEGTAHSSAPSTFGVAAAGVDWRVDSLFRRLLLHADVWIEIRGLRSGRARDCHGEICTYPLARPCRARNIPLPMLPLPADPLSVLRSKDRSARPLTQLSRLSLADTTLAEENRRSALLPAPLFAFKMDSWCEGRAKAMLFRIEAGGEAFAWSRGTAR